MEAVASTLTVMGSSMATATAGPMPGNTPTAVPMMQPTKAHIKLIGVAAVMNPCIRRLSVSMACWLYSHPVLVRPGRLMASSCVNIQYTGAATAMPMAESLIQACRRKSS